MKKKEIEIIKKIIGCTYICFGTGFSSILGYIVQWDCSEQKIKFKINEETHKIDYSTCPWIKLCNEIKNEKERDRNN